MLLKDIVELILAPKHTDNTLAFFWNASWQSTESCCSQPFQILGCNQNIIMWDITLT